MKSCNSLRSRQWILFRSGIDLITWRLSPFNIRISSNDHTSQLLPYRCQKDITWQPRHHLPRCIYNMFLPLMKHQVSTKKYYFQPLKSPPKTKISSINSEKGRKRKLNKKWVLNHNKWENSNYNRENQIEVCNAGRNGSLRLALSLDNRRKWRPSSGFLQTNEELSLSLSLSLKKRLLSISYKQ